MTALRQETFCMLEAIPEEGRVAWDDILSLSKPVPDFDEAKELRESCEEHLSYVNIG